MKTLDVITTQNVRIEYEIAGLGDRILAFLFDQVVIGVTILLLSLFLAFFWSIAFNTWVPGWADFLLKGSLFIFYTPVMEIMNNGQTVGKMALRIKVLNVHGKQPEVIELLIRWAFRFLDIWLTLGSLACMLIVSSDQSQRLGDRLSNTTLVRLSPRNSVALDQLMKMESLKDYEPTFPQIRQLSEQEMLTLKSALTRFEEYKNEAHKDALMSAVNRVKEFSGIDQGEMRTLPFIRTLIQDYVVLTR